MEQETADRSNLKNSWDHSDQELDIKEFRSWIEQRDQWYKSSNT
jgi:hypothetical protein